MTKFSLEERMEYLKEYGSHCMAYSTLQPGMQYFDVKDKGYIAYKKTGNKLFVLGNPVCSYDNMENITGEFINSNKKVGFLQTNNYLRDLLTTEFNFFGTQMGIETIIPSYWNLKGKKKQNIRTAINKIKKDNIIIKENPSEKNYEFLSNEWLNTRKTKSKEISFLVRPMNMIEKDTRKFFAYKEDKPIGLIFFDPLYSNQKIIGYVPNICRSSKDFKQGIYYALINEGFNTFKNENKYINLGLSPLKQNIFFPNESKNLKKIFNFVYNKGNMFYNFKGLDFTKSRFIGEEHPTFYLHKNKLPILDLYRVFRLSNLI
ncbi:MAG: DUF2156 domain-containing protein [Candidatus Woesearchaeota archaeon]